MSFEGYEKGMVIHMVTIIIGGSGSGKSEYAEDLIVRYGKECKGGLIYIATMQPYDKETELRIQKHQMMRQNKNFSTLECYTGLDQVKLAGHSAVLLECMSNLVANEMFSDKGAKEITREAVLQGVEKLIRQADHLVVVTNNVFEAGSDYDSGTLEYLSVLGEINNRLCSQADQVIEVIHGIPVFIKKAEG
jgi:adenosylcobinamide kinase/adenosylcobinamide-phosphate guanylyltransferase